MKKQKRNKLGGYALKAWRIMAHATKRLRACAKYNMNVLYDGCAITAEATIRQCMDVISLSARAVHDASVDESRLAKLIEAVEASTMRLDNEWERAETRRRVLER